MKSARAALSGALAAAALCSTPVVAVAAPDAMGGVSLIASYYGAGEALAPFTASGQPFRPSALAAAHRTLPLGARLLVCLARCIVVTVNDRGPAGWTGRQLDLTLGAARAIGLDRLGVAVVRVRRLD